MVLPPPHSFEYNASCCAYRSWLLVKVESCVSCQIASVALLYYLPAFVCHNSSPRQRLPGSDSLANSNKATVASRQYKLGGYGCKARLGQVPAGTEQARGWTKAESRSRKPDCRMAWGSSEHVCTSKQFAALRTWPWRCFAHPSLQVHAKRFWPKLTLLGHHKCQDLPQHFVASSDPAVQHVPLAFLLWTILFRAVHFELL